MRLDVLAKTIDAELVGEGSIEVTSCATLEDAVAGQLGFLANPKYAEQMRTTKASAVVVGSRAKADHVALLRAKDPYYAFCRGVVALQGFRKHPHQGIHPKAHVEPSAIIGDGTVIYPGCYVGARTKIGKDCILYPNVVVYEDCVLGDRVYVHANTTVGLDGFGYATHDGVHHKIPQCGTVIVEDDVEIGSSCTIQRAALGSTVIGKGSKLCDQITIGHGCKIGPYNMLVAQVGLAGSVTTGHHVTMAGQAGVAGHLKIGNNVTLAAKTGVMSDVEDGAVLIGQPGMPAQQARRVYSIFTQLPELAARVKALEQKGGGKTT